MCPLVPLASTSVSRGVKGLSPVSSAAASNSGSITRWPAATRRTPWASVVAGASFKIEAAHGALFNARSKWPGLATAPSARGSGNWDASCRAPRRPSVRPFPASRCRARPRRAVVADGRRQGTWSPRSSSATTSMSSSRDSRATKAPPDEVHVLRRHEDAYHTNASGSLR